MPDLIVADAGPLISAARAHRLELIEKVYENIIVPPAVVDEIVVGGEGRPGSDILRYRWITQQRPKNQPRVEELHKRFGWGESETVVLAEELHATIFVDELKVIQEARRRHLTIVSTLHLLLVAKEKGFISTVTKELDLYVHHGFRLSESLYEHVLKLAGEK